LIGKTNQNDYKIKNLKPGTSYDLHLETAYFAGNISNTNSIEFKTLKLNYDEISGKI